METRSTAQSGETSNSRRVVGIVIAFVCASWLGFALFVYTKSLADQTFLSKAGLYGDSFGALNVLFSGLALVGVTIAILLQTRELTLQRQELADTRRELESTRRAQEAQVENLNAQLLLNEGREKRDLCLRMLDRWTNPNMRASRLAAWECLETSYGSVLDSDDAKLTLQGFRERDHPNFEKFSDVCQFFSDLNKMLDEDVIDRDLSRILFRDSVLPWFRYIDRLDFARLGEVDSGATAGYRESVEEWYRSRVMTLKNALRGESAEQAKS